MITLVVGAGFVGSMLCWKSVGFAAIGGNIASSVTEYIAARLRDDLTDQFTGGNHDLHRAFASASLLAVEAIRREYEERPDRYATRPEQKERITGLLDDLGEQLGQESRAITGTKVAKALWGRVARLFDNEDSSPPPTSAPPVAPDVGSLSDQLDSLRNRIRGQLHDLIPEFQELFLRHTIDGFPAYLLAVLKKDANARVAWEQLQRDTVEAYLRAALAGQEQIAATVDSRVQEAEQAMRIMATAFEDRLDNAERLIVRTVLEQTETILAALDRSEERQKAHTTKEAKQTRKALKTTGKELKEAGDANTAKILDAIGEIATIPGLIAENLREPAPGFVGRLTELDTIHASLQHGAVGLRATLHGLGGQGKTELAIKYAHEYRAHYRLGIWVLAAEGRNALLPLIATIASRTIEGETDEVAGRRVLETIAKTATSLPAEEHPPLALLILDNISDPALLSSPELAKVRREIPIRILATTRLDEKKLGGLRSSLTLIPVDSLPEDVALALIRSMQPAGAFSSPEQEDAARTIVQHLDGFTIAVEQVALYLGLNPRVAPLAYLRGLEARGLDSHDRLAERDDVAREMHHREKQLRLILDDTLATLQDSPAAVTALHLASFLPPEVVPWPWIADLLKEQYSHLAEHAPDDPDALEDLRERLVGMRLLTPGTQPELLRMHRLISEHLRRRADDGLCRMLERRMAHRIDIITDEQAAPSPWELDALITAIPLLVSQPGCSHELPQLAVFLVDRVFSHRTLTQARLLLSAAHDVLKSHAESAPANAGWQRDLAVSYDRIGNMEAARGNLDAALVAYSEGLAIAKHLAASDTTNAGWQRGLSVSHGKIGDMEAARGNLDVALAAYSETHAILKRLAASDTTNAGWQRDLSVSHDNIGDMEAARGNLDAALAAYSEGLAIAKRLAASDTANAGWQRDLSVSYNNIGDMEAARGNLDAALAAHSDSLAIRKRLAASDTTNAGWQRDLWVSYWKVAGIWQTCSFPEEANQNWRAAYDVLSGMKKKGLHISPGDLKFLKFLEEKVAAMDNPPP
ncbi:hypothetical protein GC173_13610 [bacterium]|nr:hypothetical protein [bacterium]